MRRGGACAPSSASAVPNEEQLLARPLMPPEPRCSYGTASACPDSSKRPLWFVYLAFCFPALAGFLFGYDIGGASGAVTSINHQFNSTLSAYETSLLTSASLIGATGGSVAAIWLGEPLGRRRELLAGAGLYLLGSSVSVAVPSATPSTFAMIATGRIVFGLGIALCMNAAPTYIAEMAPPVSRTHAPTPVRPTRC